MRHILTGAIAMTVLNFPAAQALDLKGDPEAVDRIELMLERLGGAEAWADARTLHLVYDGWQSAPAKYLSEEAWRDLHEPYEYITYAEAEDAEPYLSFNMRPDSSWLWIRGEDRVFSAEEHQQNLDFWSFDFYTILHNLAVGDSRITVATGDDNIVKITGPEEADWGWFEIDNTGQPVRWGANYGDEELEYIYGPVTDYGNIAFPAWGTARDGSWRFRYTVVELSAGKMPVTLQRPSTP